MKIPRAWMTRDNAAMLIGAYLDGELDAAASLQVEQMIDSDPDLTAERDRMSALRRALAIQRADAPVPQALLDRISAIGVTDVPIAPPAPQRFSLAQMAASVLLAMALASTGTYLALTRAGTSAEFASLVTAHEAALLAPEPFAVASSDSHTVKPWFDSHLALSPQVTDLAASGFPLIGGRVDQIDGRGVPVLVYKRRAHVISLIAVPSPGSRDDLAPISEGSRDGYLVLSWRGRDFTYHAVSDLAVAELTDFVTLWRRQGG